MVFFLNLFATYTHRLLKCSYLNLYLKLCRNRKIYLYLVWKWYKLCCLYLSHVFWCGDEDGRYLLRVGRHYQAIFYRLCSGVRVCIYMSKSNIQQKRKQFLRFQWFYFSVRSSFMLLLLLCLLEFRFIFFFFSTILFSNVVDGLDFPCQKIKEFMTIE